MSDYPIGGEVWLRRRPEYITLALLKRHSAEEMGPKKAARVYAGFKAVSVHVIRRD